jgi:hypothetical protein
LAGFLSLALCTLVLSILIKWQHSSPASFEKKIPPSQNLCNKVIYLDMQQGFARCVAISTAKKLCNLSSKHITSPWNEARKVKHTT